MTTHEIEVTYFPKLSPTQSDEYEHQMAKLKNEKFANDLQQTLRMMIATTYINCLKRYATLLDYGMGVCEAETLRKYFSNPGAFFYTPSSPNSPKQTGCETLANTLRRNEENVWKERDRWIQEEKERNDAA